MSGSDSNQVLTSAGVAALPNLEFPGYPTTVSFLTMPDPLAINRFHYNAYVPGPVVNMGMSITDPASFTIWINGIQDPAPNTPMGHELLYTQVAQQTNTLRIKDAAAVVTQQATYPANNCWHSN